MKARAPQEIPEDTRKYGELLLDDGDVYRMIGERLNEFVSDADYSDLYPVKGRPAIGPGLLAMVLILEWMDCVSDRQAAYLVKMRIDWKYALRLPLTYEGFDHSVLCEFRGRLVKHGAEMRVFEKLLSALKSLGLVSARGVQRTDGLAVLSATDRLSRLELLYETLRVALMAMKRVQAEWFEQMIPGRLVQDYGERGEQDRWVKERGEKGQAEVRRLAQRIGVDGQWVLQRVTAKDTPEGITELAEIKVLRTVWEQQFTVRSDTAVGEESEPKPLVLREKMAEKGAELIRTPHDPEVRYSAKRGKDWEGYKVHLTETADEDQPRIITDVRTTLATESDFEQVPIVQERLVRREIVPAQHVVDMGYVSAQNIAESEERQIDLIGPARPDGSKQAHLEGGVTLAQFDIDETHQSVHCPQGHTSISWNAYGDPKHPTIDVTFDGHTCAACPWVARCVTRKPRPNAPPFGRTLQMRPYYAFLSRQRQRQTTSSFKAVYRRRAGIEATLSMAVRKHGLRRCRYIGLKKTALQHTLIATACNLKRTARWLAGERPVERGRRPKLMQLKQSVRGEIQAV